MDRATLKLLSSFRPNQAAERTQYFARVGEIELEDAYLYDKPIYAGT
jgi:hypothetical protein